MKSLSPKAITQLFIIAVASLLPITNRACTIASAIARNGHVWNANNEDGPFGVGNFINVFPKSGNSNYGYYTLSYLSPRYGQDANIQGGMNEAGLTFDFNAIRRVEDFDPSTRKEFPGGNDAILTHILGTMSTTQEVMEFFQTYWFKGGFQSAQMHVADRHGRFAIISASGIELVKKGEHLVSTNFDICGQEDGSYCWRYPLATNLIETKGASLHTMMEILEVTAQKNGGTMYSNVQNLSTGDIWFFSKHNPGLTVNTNIKDLLAKGQNSYSFSNLGSLLKEDQAEWKEPKAIQLNREVSGQYSGTYMNSFTGQISVLATADGIQLMLGDAGTFKLLPCAQNVFFLPEFRLRVEFIPDHKGDRMEMKLLENGWWSFTATKTMQGQ